MRSRSSPSPLSQAQVIAGLMTFPQNSQRHALSFRRNSRLALREKQER